VRSRGIRGIGAVGFGIAILGAACATPPPPPPPPPTPVVYQNPGSLGADNALYGDATDFGSVSQDGRYVLNAGASLKLRDRQTGEVDSVGGQVDSARISANGRYVVSVNFTTRVMYDAATGQEVAQYTMVQTPVPFPTDDGLMIAGSDTGSGCSIDNLWDGTWSHCQVPSAGSASLRAASHSGRFVLYFFTPSDPTVAAGYKLWDRESGTIESVPDLGFVFAEPETVDPFFPDYDEAWTHAAVSEDGRYLMGRAPGGLPGVIDMTVHGPSAANLIPVAPADVATRGSIDGVDMSPDGRYVAVSSNKALSPGDANDSPDVYVWDTHDNSVSLASRNLETNVSLPAGARPCSWGAGTVTESGEVCVSTIDPMVAYDTNGVRDNYIAPVN
jgi:hypothetical protein